MSKMDSGYSRDYRSPDPSNDSISRIMSANRRKDTKPEVIFRKTLWLNGIRGYRLHWNKVPGRPDIAFPKKKVAIFINGCFWHRCPKCNLPLPKSNASFWKEKFKNNVARDTRKITELENNGWRVLTIWECDIKKNFKASVNKVKASLANE